MLLNDPHFSELKTQVFDIFMELNSETQELEKRAISDQNLHTRRSIEEHFEKKKLRKELIEYDFE